MKLDVDSEVAALERMTVNDLRKKYVQVFGEETRSRHKQHLVKRIVWRMQANVEGDLSERARQRAMALANDADLRVTGPRQRKLAPGFEERTATVSTSVRPCIDLPPGAVLKREYKGRMIRVTVIADGFEFDGQRYKSLTAVAKSVTGQHWNGYHFFQLRKKKQVAK